MLGHWYRYQVFNSTGVNVTVTVKEREFKYASDGSKSDASSETTRINAAVVGAGAYSNSSGVDNSSTKYLGSVLTCTFAPASSATGVVAVYLQRSTDGGTTWPDNGKGLQVAQHQFSASSTSVNAPGIVR